MQNNPPIPAESPSRSPDGQRVRNVLYIAVAATALIIASLILPACLLAIWPKHRPMQDLRPLGLVTAPDLKPLERFATPNLTVDDDRSQRIALQTEQIRKLNSYGWVDRSHGVVHIPIERAMDLAVGRLAHAESGQTNETPMQLIQKRPDQP
ncbi:MAG TPA: hypothetical protein VN625_03200 [Desulfuromonadaceae bacterium]|nr:hypothetical protein [Desulfuromonadaceae bacterium]